MNNVEKTITKAQLKLEQRALKELKKSYEKAKHDIEIQISALNSRKDMQNLQSIIYQKKYQEILLKQIEGVIDDLNKGQYETLQDFFEGAYATGYIGSMYDLHNQGIPLVIPIDPKKMVTAVMTDSKLSKNYYQSRILPENLSTLKRNVRQELTRGIASGKTWVEVAYQVAQNMNSPFNRAMRDAMRIVRTEGHRINQQGFLDASREAKDKGADVVKQWDSTLDGNTRPAHRIADGQIKELDEPFIVDGEKMDAPSIGGSARNVCNCRCQLLQRAKWALDEVELKTLQDRARFFGLDKSQDFDDFKQKYLKLPDKADVKKSSLISKINNDLSEKDIDDIGFKMLGEHWDEYREKFLGNAVKFNPDSVFKTVELGKYKDTEKVKVILNKIDELSSKFYSPLQKLKWMDKEESLFSQAFASSNHGWGYGTAEIRFNPIKLSNKGLERIAELSKNGYCVNIPKGKELDYLVSHEFGHCILNIGEKLPSKSHNFVQCNFDAVKKARKEIEGVFDAFSNEYSKKEKVYKDYSKALDSKLIFEGIPPTEEERKRLNKLKSELNGVSLSRYGMSNSDEFVAECFADFTLNGENARPISKEIYNIIEKYFGKGY